MGARSRAPGPTSSAWAARRRARAPRPARATGGGRAWGRWWARCSSPARSSAWTPWRWRAGATYVNDVTASRHEPELAGLVADRGCECCLAHMLGEPRTMQDDPRYDDVVDDVCAFLEERIAFAVGEGIREERIMVDPGIGF